MPRCKSSLLFLQIHPGSFFPIYLSTEGGWGGVGKWSHCSAHSHCEGRKMPAGSRTHRETFKNFEYVLLNRACGRLKRSNVDRFPKVFLTWNWRSCMLSAGRVILRNFGLLLSVWLSWWLVQISGHDCRPAGRETGCLEWIFAACF